MRPNPKTNPNSFETDILYETSRGLEFRLVSQLFLDNYLMGTIDCVTPASGQEKAIRARLVSKSMKRFSPSPDPGRSRSFDSSSVAAFCLFLSVNLLASAYSPIQDCDEVFNYWEPTHYIAHGFGLQTWEYSPEYAIRSWLYAVLHAIPSKVVAPFVPKKVFEFYFVRGVLGSICAGCETRLFSTVSRTMTPRIAVIFLLAMITSSGMFHASVAYLPSSFAMYTVMMGTAAFMNVKDGLKTTEGIMWFGIGATVGWPFSAALILPFIPDELTYLKRTADINGVASRVLGGALRILAIVVGFSPWRSFASADLCSLFNLLSICCSMARSYLSLGASYPTTFSAAPHEDPTFLELNLGISIFAIYF